MNMSQEIKKDFQEHIAFLTTQKMSTKVRFHRKRAGVVGSLLFLADVADKKGMLPLYTHLIEQVKTARNAVEEMFKINWIHNMRDVTKMNKTFLCDICEGYNSAREQYASKYSVNLLDKIPVGYCSTNPAVKKAINKLIAKLVAEN